MHPQPFPDCNFTLFPHLLSKLSLRTNTKLTNKEVAQSYKLLWKVERAFRELKSGLDLRPIYHYTDTRVKGHIMICFLALVMETALCRKLKEIGSTFSYAEILEDLKEIRAVELTVEGKRFLASLRVFLRKRKHFQSLSAFYIRQSPLQAQGNRSLCGPSPSCLCNGI